MAETDTLRASRDGDQFHYRWAARQEAVEHGGEADVEVVVGAGVVGASGEQVVVR